MTDEDAPDELQQSSNDGLLTLKEIAKRLDVTYGRLRGFSETPGVKQYVGAVSVSGVKGDRYPPAAQEQFARLIQAQDAGIVTPKTAPAYLQNLQESPAAASPQSSIVPSRQSDITPSGAAIAPLQQSRNVGNERNDSRNDLVLALIERVAAAAEDRLVTREEAARALACHTSAVGRYVRPVRANTWRWSDLQKYIAGLQQR